MQRKIYFLIIQLIISRAAIAQTLSPNQILQEKDVRTAAKSAMVDISKHLVCWQGKSPVFDGIIHDKEYADASYFELNNTDYYEWIENPMSQTDLNFHGWIKHDGEFMYLAFEVKDDIFYGIETERWTPPQDAKANIIGDREQGRPWFGDMIEFLFFSRMMDIQKPVKKGSQTGDGRNMQIVYNLTKSHQNGIGVAGILPHGPGRSQESWDNSVRWIQEGIIASKTAIYPEQNTYTVEVKIKLEGGIEIEENTYWSTQKPDHPIAFNFTVGDVDKQDKSPTGRLHHEVWWATKFAPSKSNPLYKGWGVLILTSQKKNN